MNLEFVFHIGMPKTGTTLLQQRVFGQLDNVAFLGRPYSSPALRSSMNSLKRDSSLFFAPQSLLDEVRSSDQSRFLISDESLADNHASQDHYAKIRGLKRIDENAQILVTLRNPRTMLVSDYLHYIRQSVESPSIPFMTLEQFFTKIRNQRSSGSAYSRLRYADIVRDYETHFGKNRVTVLLFEEMLQAPRRFEEKLGSVLDSSVRGLEDALTQGAINRAVSEPTYELARRFLRYQGFDSEEQLREELQEFVEQQKLGEGFLERAIECLAETGFHKKPNEWVTRLYESCPELKEAPKARVSLPDAIRRAVDQETVEGNRRLSEQRDLQLDSYGYPL